MRWADLKNELGTSALDRIVRHSHTMRRVRPIYWIAGKRIDLRVIFVANSKIQWIKYSAGQVNQRSRDTPQSLATASTGRVRAADGGVRTAEYGEINEAVITWAIEVWKHGAQPSCSRCPAIMFAHVHFRSWSCPRRSFRLEGQICPLSHTLYSVLQAVEVIACENELRASRYSGLYDYPILTRRCLIASPRPAPILNYG
jgi:hypothetical protein